MRPRKQHACADDVDVERREPMRACRRERIVDIGTGDVDQHVDAPEAPVRRLNTGAHRVVVGEVGFGEHRALAQRGRERAASLGVRRLQDSRNDARRAVGRFRLLIVG